MTVYKNNRDKWCVDVEWANPDGSTKRIRKTSPVQTKRGAEQYERDVRQSLADGTYGKREDDSKAPTVGEYESAYMEWCRGNKSKASGMENRASLMRRHLIPLFGTKRVDEFNLRDQRAMLSRFAKLSNSRYNNAAAVMNRLLALAFEESELEGKPFRFKLLPIKERKMSFYDFGERDLLVSAANVMGSRYEVLLLLGVDAGLRRGEMLALTVDKCDFKNRMLVIEEAEYIIRGNRNQDDTKGRNSRDVPMTESLLRALQRHLNGRRSGRVLLNDRGEPLINKQVRSMMGKIQRAAGLTETGNVHILRHTFCSHLAMRGVPVMSIKDLAGHSNLKTTMKYMHLAPGEKRRAIEMLERRSGNMAATDTHASLN